MLNRLVTTSTQGYKVVQPVGFLVSRNAECAKRRDMVDIQFSAYLLLSLAAMLAGVVVALAGGSGLWPPVWAIVALIGTAFPVWVAIAAHDRQFVSYWVRLLPHRLTCSPAKLCPSLPDFTWGRFERLTTLDAQAVNLSIRRMRLATVMRGHPFPVTLQRAEPATNSRRLDRVLLSTLLACTGIACRWKQVFTKVCRICLAATGIRAVFTRPTFCPGERLAALWAFGCNSYCCQPARLRTVNLLLRRGIKELLRAMWARLLWPLSHIQPLFDSIVIIPQVGGASHLEGVSING